MQSYKRHKNTDVIVFIIRGLSVFSWGVFILSLILFHYARPEMEFGIMRYFAIEARDYWLAKPKNMVTVLLLLSTLISAIVIFLKQLRAKRHSDSVGANQIGLVLICLFSLLVIQI